MRIRNRALPGPALLLSALFHTAALAAVVWWPGAGRDDIGDSPVIAVELTQPPAPDIRPVDAPRPTEVPPAEPKAAGDPEPARDRPPPRPAVKSRAHPQAIRIKAIEPASPAAAPRPAEPDPGLATEGAMSGQPAGPSAAGPKDDCPAGPAGGNPKPAYPLAARRAGKEGVVLLRIEVSAEGAAEKVVVARSSDVPILDQSALEAVEHWRFLPARQSGRTVPATVELPVAFRLEENPDSH